MFQLTNQSLDVSKMVCQFQCPSAGAFVSFEGRVRDNFEGRKVIALEYEALAPLCQSEADKIIAEACEKFGVIKVVCVHRLGKLKVGEISVWIGVAAGHRDKAFLACRYIIDEIKMRLPIWKKEIFDDGQSVWVTPGYDHNSVAS